MSLTHHDRSSDPRAQLQEALDLSFSYLGHRDRTVAEVRRHLERKRDRFDLQIEGNHTYLVDHVVVHNSPETQPGGRALKFYSSQRLDIRRIETLKEGTEAVGNRVRVKVVKNKVAPPFRQAEFDIEFGRGISTAGCLIDLGIENNVVTKSGSFFSYGDERLGQGRNNAKAFLNEHVEIAKEIESKIYEALEIDRDLVTPPGRAPAPAGRHRSAGPRRGRSA